jgi:hypothetical protein
MEKNRRGRPRLGDHETRHYVGFYVDGDVLQKIDDNKEKFAPYGNISRSQTVLSLLLLGLEVVECRKDETSNIIDDFVKGKQ